jgi:hypothetical protein
LQVEFPGVRRVVGALAFVFLCACSGGGDDEASRDIQLSTTSLAFAALATDAAPSPQVVSASLGEGAANIAAVHSGPAIERVDVVVNGSSAEITVVPAAPAALGAGESKATIALTPYYCGDPACSRLEAGTSRTINATYQIAPVIATVAPNAAVAGTSATVSIRGVGFQGFAIQGVRFGSTPATSITVTSGTEIRATYPALVAGTYPVTIDIATLTTPAPSTATLVVVDPLTAVTQTLPWPQAVTTIRSLEYDAERRALLATTDAAGGQLARFEFTGATWQGPATAALTDVRDAALATNGAQWVAINASSVVPVDPTTLAVGTAVSVPGLPANSFLRSIALLNSNDAVITTGIAETTGTPVYSYSVRAGVATPVTGWNFANATARGSANGSSLAITQINTAQAPGFYVASASSGQFLPTSITISQNAVLPTFDREATRFVLNGVQVFASDLALLGKLPETTAAVVLRPDGKRAYTYDSTANALLVFDISETKSGEAFAPLGDPVPLASAPGSNIKMAISADATTLFIAGTTQLVVQPTPAL